MARMIWDGLLARRRRALGGRGVGDGLARVMEGWVAAASTWSPADPEAWLSVRADCGVRSCAAVAHRVRRGGSLTRESRVVRRTPCVFWFNTGAPATRVVSRSGRRGAGAPLSWVELTVLRPCETPSLGKRRGARLRRDGGRRDGGRRDGGRRDGGRRDGGRSDRGRRDRGRRDRGRRDARRKDRGSKDCEPAGCRTRAPRLSAMTVA